MASLLQWNGPVLDPGISSTQSATVTEQTWVARAVFDVPPTPEEVYALQQCPIIYQIHPTNRYLMLIHREVRNLPDAPQVAEVRLIYSNVSENSQNANKPEIEFKFVVDPTLRPALITGGTYTVREAVERATEVDVKVDDRGRLTVNELKKNTLVATSAGEPLVLEEEWHRRRFHITKNVKKLTDIMIKGGDYINEDVVRFNGSNTTFEKGTLWVWPIEFGNLSVENGIYYFPVTMTILYNPKGWYRRVRNAGYYMISPNISFRKNANGGWVSYRPLIPIRYSNGTKPDRPVLLRSKVSPDDPNLAAGTPIQMVITGTVPAADGLDRNGRVAPNRNQIRRQFTFDVQSPEDFGRAFTEDEQFNARRFYQTFPYLNFQQNLPLT